MSQEIAQRALFTDDQLRSLQTWDDVFALFKENGHTIAQAHEVLGTGFALFSSEEKDKLCGVSIILLDWRFNISDKGNFVSVTAAAQNEDGTMRKVIFNDGGTGICAQLENLSNRGIHPPMMVKNGLVRSDYDYIETDKNGKEIKRPATTYYLSESA